METCTTASSRSIFSLFGVGVTTGLGLGDALTVTEGSDTKEALVGHSSKNTGRCLSLSGVVGFGKKSYKTPAKGAGPGRFCATFAAFLTFSMACLTFFVLPPIKMS